MGKKTLIGIFVAVSVVFVLGLIFLAKRPRNPWITLPIPRGNEAAQGSRTRSAPPPYVSVPSSNSNVAANVAKPTVVAAANPNTDASYRSFDLKMQGGEFIPNTVIVKQGDTVNINVMAVDRDYDFTQPDAGFRVPIAKGQTKKIQFGATAPGKFAFYCSACGGPEKGPMGYLLIVTQK